MGKPIPRMVRMERHHLNNVVLAPLMSGYSMRAFRPSDWDDCIDLMLNTPDPTYTAGPWDDVLCRNSMAFSADDHRDYPGGRGQLVFHGDQLVAMALASGTGYLNQVYTLPEHQRRGLALAAVSAVLDALNRQGVLRCFLMVFENNMGAIACYEALGFHQRNAGA
ncbi:MAG: GNAT family N-acetyltransferase [bacterium]|nr:GNAT family N-acetyltransferase [bacterium]